MELILTTPIKFGDEELTKLTMKKPTVREIREFGFPYTIGEDVKIIPSICAKYISRLAGIPMSVVDGMSLEDFQKACVEVVYFFGQEKAQVPAS